MTTPFSVVPLGYAVKDRKLIIAPTEAGTACHIFARYQALLQYRRDKAGSVIRVPAHSIEDAVAFALTALNEPSRQGLG
jgi:hypothetical protein